MGDPGPTIELTTARIRDLNRLTPSSNSRRGTNLLTLQPLRHWTEPVDDERVAAHLGITVPTVPALTSLGWTTSCRSYEGEHLFSHPVPSTTDPPVTVGSADDRHTVLIVHTPPTVDVGEAALADHPPTGIAWMQITYGLALLRDVDGDAELAAWELARRPDRTRLSFRDGTPVTVVRTRRERTSMRWRSTGSDRTFGLELVLPFRPLRAVQALAEVPPITLR